MAPNETLRIPQELVDAIVDELSSDHNTLASCSLVAKSWVERSRSYLFQNLKIAVIDSKRPLSSFLDHLQLPHGPFSYVQTLEVVDIGFAGGRAPFLQRVFSASHLHTILLGLRSLLELRLNHVQLRSQPPLPLPVSRHFRLQRLTILNSDIATPTTGPQRNPIFEILALFSHIDELIFESVFDREGHNNTVKYPMEWEIPPKRLAVNYLRVRTSSPSRGLLGVLVYVLRPNVLQSLSVNCMGSKDEYGIGRLVKHSASSLNYFRLEFPQYSQMKVAEFSAAALYLTMCKSLKSLSFAFSIVDLRSSRDIFSAILEVISTADRVSVTIVWLAARLPSDVPAPSTVLDWRTLDKVLQLFPRLERLKVLVAGHENLAALWKQIIPREMTSLSSKGIVYVQ